MLSFVDGYGKTFPDMQCLRHCVIISEKAALASTPMREERNPDPDPDRKNSAGSLKSGNVSCLTCSSFNIVLSIQAPFNSI